MPRIYLTRHSQTLFNLQYRTQGQCDSPLTEKGIAMAKRLGEYFRENNYHFDHGFCSTSERTEDTLNYITDSSVAYTRLKGLKELNFGIQEGGSDQELWANGNYVSIDGLNDYLAKYGAEKVENLIDRMNKSMKMIASTDYQSVIVVTHGLSISAWFYSLGEEFAEELFKFKGNNEPFLGNCDCVVLDYEDDKFIVVDYIPYKKIEGDKND